MNSLAHRLRELIESEDECVLALLFGSHAHGTANANSDVDLALLGTAPISTGFKLRLMRRLGRELGLSVDLVDLHDAPEPVTGEALRGVRLFGADEVFAELLIRHLDNVEDFVPLQRRILDERRERWLRR